MTVTDTDAAVLGLTSQRILADHRLAGWLNQFDEQSTDDRHDFLMVLSDALEDFGYEDGAACLRWCGKKERWPRLDCGFRAIWYNWGPRDRDYLGSIVTSDTATHHLVEGSGCHDSVRNEVFVAFATVYGSFLWLIDHWHLIKAEMKTW